MSFVLEALKKQEADGDPDAAVSLARAAVRERRYRIWVVLFALAMAVNAALLVWVFDPLGRISDRPSQAADAPERARPGAADNRWASPPPPQTGSVSGPATTARAAAAPTGRPAAAPAQASAPARVQPATPAPTTPAPATSPPAATPAQPDTVALADLPPQARARFPGIAFSTHIYGEDQELRAVVANGKRHQEGDRIRGLEILEITAGGVVLAFESYRVEVPVVVDWDSL